MHIWLVGAGYWGSKVKEALSKIPDVTDVTIVDIREGKTIDDITTKDPVILATPLWQHASQVIELLKHGHDVYCEKPLAETLEECMLLETLVRDQVLMVGHIFLYNPLLHELKNVIDSGELGIVHHIESRRLNWGIRQTKTTPLLSLAPHDVSIVNYLIPEAMSVTHAKGISFSNNTVPDYVEFGDINYTIKVSWWWPKRERIVTVIGDRGQAVWDEDSKQVVVFAGKMDGDYPVREVATRVINYTGPSPLENELAHFVDCVKTRKTPRTDVNNAVQVAEVLDAAAGYLSLK